MPLLGPTKEEHDDALRSYDLGADEKKTSGLGKLLIGGALAFGLFKLATGGQDPEDLEGT